MSKHGTYYVKNEAKDKDRSFTYFICSLAIFLLVLLTIYSILVYYTGNLKKMQNRIVDRNAQTYATDSIIAHATHETVRLNKTSTKSVAAESNVTYSGDILEKNLDDNHTNKPDFSTPVIKRFTDYLQPLHGRSEFEPTNMFESDNATTRHPNYTSETSDEYTPSLASPSQQSTIVTDSTVSSNDALVTIVQDQDTSAMKQSSLGEIDSNESSFTATQSPLVTNSTETIQALDSIHGTIIQHNLEYSTEKSNILYGTDSGSYSTIVSDSTKCIQALNGAPGTHFIQTTTKKYLEEGIEKSNVEMYESSATIYSKLAGDSTEWIQKLKDVPESPSTPTSIQQNLDRSTEKSKVLHETYPGASITYPKLLTDSKGWIQMVKGVPATSFISTTTPRLEDDMKTINGLDEKYSTEIGFTKMKLYNQSSNNMPHKFSSAPDYQGIHTEKQNVLDEINSDTPHPSNRSREFPELTKSANSSSSKFFTAQTPVFFEKTSPVVPSSSISRSKMFVQSGASNELQNISMTTTIFGSEEKLSDTYNRTTTKAQPIIREPTEENTTFITPQNVTTSPYRESKITFSSIVELLSVTGSLLPLTASLEDKNQTKVSTPDVRDVAISQTTLSNNDRKLDLESFNKLDGDICDSYICKRAASKALYQINFDADVCKNPYSYFCDGGKVKKWDFLTVVFKQIISFIKTIDEKSAIYFQVFGKTFDMCNKISSMNVFEQVKIDDDTFPKYYKDVIGELLLTKSLPLFDMNVDPIGNLFQIQISPPSLKLQTSQSTFRWSLLDHIRSSCINEITQTLNATVDMKVIKNKSKECCKKKLLSYIQKYVATTDQSSTQDLQTIILKVYDRWIEKYFFETHEDSENNFVNMTMEDFCDSKDYNLGVDWRHLFSMMGIPYNETISIRIYYPKQVKMVISEVKSNKRKIIDILRLWYRIQAYSNMAQIINRNNARSCLELVTELMPQVTTIILQQVVDESMYKDSLSTVKTLFDNLHKVSSKLLLKINVGRKSYNLFEDELDKVKLMPYKKMALKQNYDHLKVENTFYGTIMALLKHKRKLMFRIAGEKLSDEFLLKYYVNPFDSGLHTFHQYKTIVFQPGFLYRARELEPLPRPIYLSKLGFILTEALAKLYVNVDKQRLKTNKPDEYRYLFERDEYIIRSLNLQENDVEVDKVAFELIAHQMFNESREVEKMIWLNDTFSNSQAFISTTMQEFCDWSTVADVTKELYDNQIPNSFRVKNMMMSSKFSLESYNCQ